MDELKTFSNAEFFDYWGYLRSVSLNGHGFLAMFLKRDHKYAHWFQIDWTDPWLIGLVACHLLITSTTFLTRNYGGCQIVLFMLLCK